MEDKTILSILTPLVIAIGSGLAFIAYRHPREFRILSVWIFCLLGCLSVGGVIWDASNSAAHTAVMESNAKIDFKTVNDLSAAIRAVSLPWWWFLMLLCAGLYELFLLSFPFWLLRGTDQSNQSKQR